MTLDELGQHITPRALRLVNLLSKWWDDQDHEAAAEFKWTYYQRILSDPEAITIKILDRADNLWDMTRMLKSPGLKRGQVSWADRYARKTMAEFGPLIDQCIHPEAIVLYNNHLKMSMTAVANYHEMSAVPSQSTR